MANTEMQKQDSGISLMLGRMRMGAVPVQKLEIILMPGQIMMLQKQRRPSASLSVAWRARSNLVLTDSIHC
jgi:hypothetical protein